MNIKPVVILLIILSKSIFADPTYYVDPVNGDDGNPGTITLPLKTLAVAIPKITNAGGYVYLRGGTYNSSKISLSKIATASGTIKIWAYNNENAVIDFASSADDGFSLSGNYYHFKGLEIIHAPHNAIKCTGSNNIFEACKIHSCGNTGLQIGSSSGTAYPSNNLILNCDSYLNYDASGGGANADGFGVKWNTGAGNVFKGCRSWQNSDDGWDLWMSLGSVEIDSCFAFRNGVNSWGGTLSGNNGNGFKLGGNYIATPHIVKNCVAFDNAGDSGNGFDENHNTYGQTIYNCLSFRNKGDNYHFADNPITGLHIIKNCISYTGTVNIINATLSNNSWPSLTPVAADFVSLDTSLAIAPRQANGNLPDNGFFRLKSGSKFIDSGVNVGIPFIGTAPDIGAFEFTFRILNLTTLLEAMYIAGGTAMTMTPEVTVELHDGSTLALVEAKTGTLSKAGIGLFTYLTAANGTPYYIVVKSANTVETWSSTAVSFTAGVLAYDFTTGTDKAYTDGSNPSQAGYVGKFCIYSGDVNQDGFITSDDYTGVDNDNTNFDYHAVNDVNGDGFVTSDDYTFIDNNNSKFIQKQIPTSK